MRRPGMSAGKGLRPAPARGSLPLAYLLAAVFAAGCFSDFPEVLVLSPDGGEVWLAGTEHVITWGVFSHEIDNVRIEYSRDGGASWEPVTYRERWYTGGPYHLVTADSVYAALGEVSWGLPSQGSTNCLVRVQAVDGSASDTSDRPFAIGPAINVTAPRGGESWPVASEQTVAWTATAFPGNVKIELSRDGGGTWETVVSSVAAFLGSYTWTVTGPVSSNCIIRVADAADGATWGQSASTFAVTGRTVTSPNGGETWNYGGADRTITWTSVGVTGNVDIHYSTDAGTSWTDVALDVADTGSYVWTIPNEASDQCLVRVGEAGGGARDESDATFTITPGSVTVTAPNGDETWLLGSSRDIEWLAVHVADVRIELSRDGGAGWETIAASVPAALGSYSWTVEEPLSTDCLVRVSDAAWPSTSDVSDSPFAIRLFTDIGAGLTGVRWCSLAWGDYDNDGDLDLALAGNSSSGYVSKVYRNDGGGVFTDISAGLTGVRLCSLAWGDYDNDGDLDLALAGLWWDGSERYDSKIYRNDGGTFTDIGAGLTGVSTCSLAWGDYDNDGDLDLALAGGWYDGTSHFESKVYRNDGGGTFTTYAVLTEVRNCSLAWGDYDNDGDLDLALAGLDASNNWVSKVYRNDAGTFTDTGAGLTGVYICSLAWGDYDNDGDLDLALAGATSWFVPGDPVSKVYRNDGGTFTDIGAGLTGVHSCSLAWGDYDNDGDLDLALAGYSSTEGPVSKVYRYDAGTFTAIDAGLTGVRDCSLAWGDYDNDGDLDLALAGSSSSGYVGKVYRNNGGTFNTAPVAPTGLGATYVAAGPDYDVTFTWDAPAVADETPEAGLSYNLRVGTTAGGNEVFSGMADATTGLRRIPARGAAQPGPSWNEWTLTLPAGTYHWSVQAIDTGLAGGAWATEQSETVP